MDAVELKQTISELLAEISKETCALSYHVDDHPKLLQIIDMGDDATPILLEHLRDYRNIRARGGGYSTTHAPWYAIIALLRITGANPIQPKHSGQLLNIIDDWLAWRPDDISTNGNLTYWPGVEE